MPIGFSQDESGSVRVSLKGVLFKSKSEGGVRELLEAKDDTRDWCEARVTNRSSA